LDGTITAARPITLRFAERMQDAFADRVLAGPHTYRITLTDDAGLYGSMGQARARALATNWCRLRHSITGRRWQESDPDVLEQLEAFWRDGVGTNPRGPMADLRRAQAAPAYGSGRRGDLHLRCARGRSTP
jgi:hypothetical protein